jgi:hypothetical protein
VELLWSQALAKPHAYQSAIRLKRLVSAVAGSYPKPMKSQNDSRPPENRTGAEKEWRNVGDFRALFPCSRRHAADIHQNTVTKCHLYVTTQALFLVCQ